MCLQSSVPAQLPRIHVSKIRLPVSVASLVRKLKDTGSHSGAVFGRLEFFCCLFFFVEVVCLVIAF